MVGELVKPKDRAHPQPLPVHDDSASVVSVVQAMIKAGTNYAVVRKAVVGGAEGAGTIPGALTTRRKRKAEVYLGLFDWRDLNALLVQVCKTNRLHGSTTAPLNEKAAPSAATAAAQNALRLQQEGRLAGEEETKVEDVTEAETPKRDHLGAWATTAGVVRQTSFLPGGAATKPVGRPLVPAPCPPTARAVPRGRRAQPPPPPPSC